MCVGNICVYVCLLYLTATVATIASLVAQLVKEPARQCRRHKRCRFDPCVGKTLGEGNGNPLQSSCLENLTDRGAWWAAVHGVAKSWIQLNAHTHTHTQLLSNPLEMIMIQVTVSMGILIPWSLSHVHNCKLASILLPCLQFGLNPFIWLQKCSGMWLQCVLRNTADCRSEGKHFPRTVIK